MKKTYLYCLCLSAILFVACNNEADILPGEGSMIKLVPGERDEIPISLTLMNNGDYLIVSNSSALLDAERVSKIRLIRMTSEGKVLFDKTYPEDNGVSWSAQTAHLVNNDIIIGGNISVPVGGNSVHNNMLFLRLNGSGDSVQFKTNYSDAPYYLDGQLVDSELLVMTTDRSNKIDMHYLQPSSLSLGTGATKSFVVDTLPAASLLLKGDTVAFATKQTVNYSLLQANQDLDEDARLKTINNSRNYKIRYLFNTPLNNTAVAFGVVVGANSQKIFSMLSDVEKNKEGAFTTIYDPNIASNDVMHQVKVENDHIFICGARSTVGVSNRGDFLLMKLDHSGRLQFSRGFGSSESDNELYDAIWDNGRIVTVGTTSFGGKQSIVITTLSETGRLIR